VLQFRADSHKIPHLHKAVAVGRNSMTDPQTFKFPLTVWLYTILTSPILVVIAIQGFDFSKLTDILKALPDLIPMSVVSGIISLPTLFFYCQFYRKIERRNFKPWVTRFWMILCGILCVIVTLYGLGFVFSLSVPPILDPSVLSIIVPYIISLSVFSMVFKLSSSRRTMESSMK
jgi:hypothetical protein